MDIIYSIRDTYRLVFMKMILKPQKGRKQMNNRDRSIDILRGIGIVLMITGHIGIGISPYEKYFSWWYHAFHMPMFYLISGCFFDRKRTEIQSFISHKAKTLLLPYAFWGTFHILYNYTLNGDTAILRKNIEYFFVDPTIGQVPIAGALWFLPALFWMSVIYFYINNWFRGKWQKYAVSLTIGLCGMVATQNGIHLPFAMDAALVGVAFIGTGAVLHEILQERANERLSQMKWYVFFPLLILVNVLIFCNEEVNFRSGIYNNYALAYLNAVFPTVILWRISQILDEKLNGKWTKLAVDALSTIGRESIIYVCLNQWIIKSILPVLTGVGSGRATWQLIARGMTLILVCFICNVVIRLMLQNDYMKQFVGKQ